MNAQYTHIHTLVESKIAVMEGGTIEFIETIVKVMNNHIENDLLCLYCCNILEVMTKWNSKVQNTDNSHIKY